MSWPKGKARGNSAVVPVGRQFNRLTVIGRNDQKMSRVHWDCLCQCGTQVSPMACDVVSGHTKSCGCFDQDRKKTETIKHGHAGSATYISWCAMRARCENDKLKSFKHYGGRGITVCSRWKEFENFLSDMGERPAGKSIDRIDNQRGYEPGNCRWATASEQRRNQRTKDEIRAAAAIGAAK